MVKEYPTNITPQYQGKHPTCGQTCVAMLADVTIEEVQELCGKKGGTSAKDLIKALNALGFVTTTSKLIVLKEGQEIPDINCLIREKIRDFSHWLLYWDGELYDPASVEGGPPLRRGKLTSYIPVKWIGVTCQTNKEKK